MLNIKGLLRFCPISAAADPGRCIGKTGLQLIADAKAHGRAQCHAVDGVVRVGHFHFQRLAQLLGQAVQLGTAACQHHTVAVDITGQLGRGLLQHLMGCRADLLA